MRFLWVSAVFLSAAMLAQAANLYRWVDENGKVQFSDKPPSGQTQGVTQLDKSGRALNSGSSKKSEEERAAEQEKKLKEQEQRRKDRALLQSFSKPEEIDLLRDRQIEAVESGKQTNRLRRQAMQTQQERLTKQVDRLSKAKKPIPADLQTELNLNRSEIKAIEDSLARQDQDIAAIKARAEADKKRLVELRSVGPN